MFNVGNLMSFCQMIVFGSIYLSLKCLQSLTVFVLVFFAFVFEFFAFDIVLQSIIASICLQIVRQG